MNENFEKIKIQFCEFILNKYYKLNLKLHVY